MGIISSKINIIKGNEQLLPLKVNELNEDVMIIIFKFFTIEELLILSKVCVQWKAIINEMFIRRKCLYFTPAIGLPIDLWLQQRVQFIDYNKQTLIPINKIESYKSFVSEVISKCLTLKSINFVGLDFDHNCTPFRLLIDYCDSDITHINFSHLHNKRNFEDKRIPVKEEEMKEFVKKFPNIVQLSGFRSWFRFSYNSITQLISGLNKLEILCFCKETDCTESQTSDISGDYFQFINPDIQVIRVTKKILGLKGLYYLTKRVKSLKELRIDVIDSIENLKLICEHFQSLKCLSFKFEINSQQKFEAFGLMSSLHNLEEVDIVMSDKSEENGFTSDSCLLELMKSIPLMKSIIFSGKFTEGSVKFVDMYWPQLEKLQIKSKLGSAISSTIVKNIAKLNHLKYLDLNNSNITDDDIFKLMSDSSKVRFIDLSGTRITDKTIEFLIRKAKSMPNEKFEIILRRTSVQIHELKNILPNNLLTHLSV